MRSRIITPANLLMIMLGLVLAMPVAVEARGGYNRHDYSYGPGYGRAHHHHHHHKRHHKKRHYKKHHYYGGYQRIYNQPYYVPQPQYVYPPQYINYPPVVGYGYPPNVILGINAGNASFSLRY